MSQTAAAGRSPVPDSAGSPWAKGASVFAGLLMATVGLFQFFEGLVALVDGDDFLLATRNYIFKFDATTWGWIHIVLGVVVTAAGIFIFTGNVVARSVGVFIACLAALANFLWIPYYPLWALTTLALNVFVIWGLVVANLGEE